MAELKTNVFFLFFFLSLSLSFFPSTLVRDSKGIRGWQKPGLQYQGRQKRNLNKDRSEALFQCCRRVRKVGHGGNCRFDRTGD